MQTSERVVRDGEIEIATQADVTANWQKCRRRARGIPNVNGPDESVVRPSEHGSQRCGDGNHGNCPQEQAWLP